MIVTNRLIWPIAAVLIATPLHARITTAIFTGTITENDFFGTLNHPGAIDSAGLFGTPGASLVGQSVNVVFRIDDQTGGTLRVNDPPVESAITSPQVGGLVSPRLSTAVIRINGTSVSVDGTDGGADYRFNYPGDWGVGYSSFGLAGNGRFVSVQTSVYSYVNDFVNSYDYHAPLYHEITANDIGIGLISIGDIARVSGTTTTFTLEQLGFTPSSVLISSDGGVSPVPDPDSWLTLIVGFAGMGCVWRTMRSDECPSIRASRKR